MDTRARTAPPPLLGGMTEAWWRHRLALTTRGVPVGRWLFYGFVLALPLTDVLSPSPWLPPPMAALLFLGLFTLLSPQTITLERSDSLLAAVVVSCVLPYLWSMEFAGAKSAAHLVAFVTTLGIYYLLVRCWLARIVLTEGRLQRVFDLVAVSTLVTSSYVLLEFLLVNLAGFDPSGPLPHLTRPDYLASVLHETGALVSRARGFASESGIMSLFFELAIFVSFFSVRRLRWPLFVLFYAVVLGAFLLLFSVGGIVSVVAASAVYGLLAGPKQALKVVAAVGLAAATVVLAFPEETALFVGQTFATKLAFLTEANPVGSAGDRIDVYRSLARLIAEFPLGIGIGIAPEVAESGVHFHGHRLAAGQVSLYGFLLVSGGVVAVFAFGLFLAVHLLKALESGPYRGPLFMAGTSLAIHHLLVTEYWLPTLWFYFALVSVVHRAYVSRPQERSTRGASC